MNLYQEHIMDHYRNPRNRGELCLPDFTSNMLNPSCGDAVCMQGKVEQGIIKELSFTGYGCVISQAAASMLAQAMVGKSLEQIQDLTADSMKTLVGIELGPMRMKCAVLSLEALQHGIEKLASC